MTITLDLRQAIPGYTLEKRIGAGGYGEVWRAEAPGGLLKAVKIVFGYVDGDQALREMKALQRVRHVRHPFLLSLERIDVVDCRLVIVTELADGSLKDRFDAARADRLPGIPRAELLGYLRDAADAFDYMSDQHNLQHLDVKPENLLLVGGRVKVADFGLVKDLQDPRVSMPAGLTPMYAPPEIFHGAPSTHSDQYSLAIVYQEMLTGQLPFPGKTAAQLAAQHLTATPRLHGLTPVEQQVILRALAKDPKDRFASCRELVDSLAACGAAAPPPHAAAPGAEKEDTSAAAGRKTQRSVPLTPQFAATAPLEAEPAEVEHGPRGTQAHFPGLNTPEVDDDDEPSEHDSHPSAAESIVAPRRIVQPRLIIAAPPEPVEMKPGGTLILGIGGLGGRVLRRLRQLESASRTSQAPPAPRRLLLIETDSQAILDATSETEDSSLRPEETCFVPLRRAQHYRSASTQLLSWLSRRWLYNIPRSLLTEGRRPLGRLALFDHAEEARNALAAAWDSCGPEPPARVWIVASPSGGAGSGMLLDLAAWVNRLARQRKVELSVNVLLLHAAPRQPAARDLASANALACLTELAHEWRNAENPSLRPAAVYAWQLGETETSGDTEARLDEVCRYLHLETSTTAAAHLEAARREPAEQPTEAPVLRTFQVRTLLGEQTPAVRREAAELVRAFLLGWGAAGEESGRSPAAQHGAERAQRQIEMLGLKNETIVRRVNGLFDQAGSQSTEASFRTLTTQLLPRSTPGAVAAQIDESLANLLRGEADSSRGVSAKIHAWSADTAEQIVQWIRQLVASFDDGPGAAWAAFRIVSDQLQGVKDAFMRLSEKLSAELEAQAARLATEPELSATRNARQRAARQAALERDLFEYTGARIMLAALQSAQGYIHGVQSNLQVVHEELRQLRQPLVESLAAVENQLVECRNREEAGALANLLPECFARDRHSLLELLAERLAEAVADAKTDMQQWLVAVGPERLQRRMFEAALSICVPHAVGAAAEEIVANPAGPLAHYLRNSVEEALPELAARCGGRLFNYLLIPTQWSDRIRLRGLEVQVVGGAADQPLAICSEVDGVSAVGVAAEWIDERRDLAQAAAHLHTRTDITYEPLR